jgi:hypothetical protein
MRNTSNEIDLTQQYLPKAHIIAVIIKHAKIDGISIRTKIKAANHINKKYALFIEGKLGDFFTLIS